MTDLVYGNPFIPSVLNTSGDDVALLNLEFGALNRTSSRTRMMHRPGFPSFKFVLAVLVVFISLSWCEWISETGRGERPLNVPSNQRINTISITKRITEPIGASASASSQPSVRDIRLVLNSPSIKNTSKVNTSNNFYTPSILSAPTIFNTSTSSNASAIISTAPSIANSSDIGIPTTGVPMNSTILKLITPDDPVVIPRPPVNPEIKLTLSLIEEGEGQVTLSKSHRDVILALGPVDIWKSTLIQFLTQNDSKLISYETAPDSEKYFIQTEPEIQPFPQLYLDTTNDLAFYDCPQFLDTPNLSTEIPAAYFTKRLIEHARAVKLILVAPYSSVTPGNSRLTFTSLITHLNGLVKNLTKFKDSIALVVTDVENEYSRKTKDYVSDEIVIRNIGDFLKQEAGNYREEKKLADPPELTDDEAVSARLFIEALTTVDKAGTYNKIGILRRPDEAGPIDQSAMLQRCKTHVLDIIKNNLVYQPKTKSDFGYTISSSLNQSVLDLAAYVNIQAKDRVDNLTNALSEQLDTITKNSSDWEASKLELENKLNLSRETLSKLNETKGPTAFFKAFQKGVPQLGVGSVASKENADLRKYGRYLSFLEEASGTQELLDVGNPLEAFQNKVENYVQWYELLFNVYGILSTYEYQSNSSLSNATNLLDWGVKGQIASNASFDQFCSIPAFNSSVPTNLLLTDDKLADLNLVFREALQSPSPVIDYVNRTLTVRGNFIKISEIKERIENTENLQLVRIYASQTVFIDASLKLPGVSLSVFAPNWDVVGNQTIDLDGIRNTENLGKAHDVQVGQDGRSGIPGRPGGAGGNFLGVGSSFLNSENLRVSARGGKGGKGQDGGTGGEGISGTAAPFPPKEDMLTKIQPGGRYPVPSYPVGIMGVDWLKSNVEEYKGWETVIKRNFIVYGSKGERGRRGGNGGVGGRGGLGGNMRIISLSLTKEKPSISIDSRPGEVGEIGLGGNGGVGGRDGPDIKVAWVETTHGFTATEHEWKLKSTGDPKSPLGSGPSGINGTVKEGMKEPTPPAATEEWALQISGFKQYLRSNSEIPITKSQIASLKLLLEANHELNSFYNALGLLDDFVGLEKQFNELYRTVDFRPSYESLLMRTETYAESVYNEDDMGRRKALAWLNTALRMKILSLRLDSETTASIPDLDGFFTRALLNLGYLRNATTESAFHQQYREFEASLAAEIVEIQNLNSQIVVPSIESTIEELAAQFKEEPMRSKNDPELEQEYNQNQVLSSFFETVLTIGNFGKFCGLVAQGALEGQGYTIAESFVLDADQMQVKPENAPRTLRHALTFINELIETQKDAKVQSLRTQLTEISKTININSTGEIHDLKIRLQLLKSRLESEDNSPDTNYDTIMRLNELKDHLSDAAALRKFDHLRQRVNVNRKDSRSLRRFEKSVYKALSSTMTGLTENLNEINRPLGSGSSSTVGIDASKWLMEQTLTSLIQELDEAKLEFKLTIPYTRTTAKLREALIMLKSVYSRMEIAKEQKLLGSYIANIKSPGSTAIDLAGTSYEAYVTQLDQATQSTLVVMEFKKVVLAFQQYVFPFANRYTESYYLDISSTNGEDELITQSRTKVEQLKKQLTRHQTAVADLVVTEQFSEQEPFYKWDSLDFQQEITSLLSGEAVTFQAELKHSDKAALNIQRLEIMLELSDSSRQAELDSILENYDVELRSSGNSYFGLGGSVYTLNTGSRKIGHSFSRSLDGRPKYSNEGYAKVTSGNLLLSPFTLWTVQILPLHWRGFDELREFGQIGVNLLMVGEGQYLGSGVNGSWIHDLHLEKYYQRVTETGSV